MGHVVSVDDKVFGRLLQDFYQVMKLEKQADASVLAKTVDEMRKGIGSQEALITSDLLIIRYKLMLDEVMAAERLMNQFEAQGRELFRHNIYLYHYFKGQISSRKKKWKEAICFYEQAESYLTEEEEKADFYYKLANAYYQTCIPALSALNTTKALHFAEHHQQRLHVAKCKLLLGLNYLEVRNFEQAEYCMQDVLECQPDELSLGLTAMVHHNLGLLYFVQHKFETAISFFEKAVHAEPKTHYLKSLYYLAESLFRANQTQEAIRYYRLGFVRSKKVEDTNYQWAFAMLHKQFIDHDNFEAVWTRGISYYESNGDRYSVHYYSLRLAEYYTFKGEEEKANHYYQLAVR
ncbi:tetratricopeptide repeat protein [Terribacillus saccharophilus]|uniref:hypothetical protein n=1 Tax=Terribacillus saccharophilus TaxID=361277 RepID=UPI0039826420